jgi:protein MpaA
MSDSDLLPKAIQAFKAGERERAQAILTQLLATDAKNDQAWLWMAACVSDDEKKRYCLNRALAIRPDNAQARQALEQLDQHTTTPAIMEDLGSGETVSTEPAVETQEQPGEPETPIPAEGDEAAEAPAIETPAAPLLSEAKPERVSVKPTKKKRSGLSRSQSCFLTLLAIIMLIIVAGLVLIVFQNSGFALPAAPAPPAQAPGQPAPLTFVQLPPTWTPEPTRPSIQYGPTLVPTSTYGSFSTPLPSLTPIASERRLVIGRSVQNRPIEVYRFGNGSKERMIVAGIHGGDEGNTIALAEELIAYLRRHPRTVPPGYTLYILRSLNPDGELLGNVNEARLNGNGVDLNRNFDVGWKSEWRSTGCSSGPGTAGSGPGSEPETQALKDFLRSRQVEVLISYHSAYLGVFPSGEPAHPESIRLAQAIHDISNYPYPPVRSGCEYTGTLVDWAASNGVMAAVDLELNSGVDTELETNLGVLSLLLSFEPQAPPPSPSAVTPADTLQGPTAAPTSSVTYTSTPTVTLTVPADLGLTPTP